MTTFDGRSLRAQALRRYRTSASSHAAGRYLRDLLYVRHLDAFVSWCEQQGLHVEFVRETGAIYDPANKTIRISVWSSPESQLYLGLHEYGHFLVYKHDAKKRFVRGWAAANDPRVSRTWTHKAITVAEELEAWKRGRNLAAKLGLSFDAARFDRFLAKQLKTYFKWALGPRDRTREEGAHAERTQEPA